MPRRPARWTCRRRTDFRGSSSPTTCWTASAPEYLADRSDGADQEVDESAPVTLGCARELRCALVRNDAFRGPGKTLRDSMGQLSHPCRDRAANRPVPGPGCLSLCGGAQARQRGSVAPSAARRPGWSSHCERCPSTHPASCKSARERPPAQASVYRAQQPAALRVDPSVTDLGVVAA
jgi:hypothetical protein